MRPELEALARDIVAVAYLKGDFLLRSGRRSNVYFDKYLFETRPALLRTAGQELARLVPEDVDRLAAPELGAVLLGGAVMLETELPLVIVRKEAKDYGTSKPVEGVLEPGERVCLIEDVLTTGGEALKATERLRGLGAQVVRLIAVIDREEGAAEAIAAAGVEYRPLFRKSDLALA